MDELEVWIFGIIESLEEQGVDSRYLEGYVFAMKDVLERIKLEDKLKKAEK